MMLSARVGGTGTEDGDKWPHLRFAGRGAEEKLNDLCSSSEEDQPSISNPRTSSDVGVGITEDAVITTPEETIPKRRIFKKRVSFPEDHFKLVSHFIEPVVPNCPEGQQSEATCQNLIAAYTASCQKNDTAPVDKIIEQLKTLDLNGPRSASLTLRGLSLGSHDCESLEDVLKTVRLKLLDLGATHTNDDGLIALFDMIEFYEAASHVSIAANKNMSNRGWQACCRMIKRTECLEWLDAAQVSLSEHSSVLLARALRFNSRLRVLHLNGCSISGRPLATIAGALKMNSNLRELHLAENKLTPYDALQLAMLLTGNKSIQLIDLRNNEIRDKGLVYLCDALMDNMGLTSLTVWNNGITRESSPALAKLMATNQSLQTLNLGHNKFTDEGLVGLISNGLEKNRHLLHLGLQENSLTCGGIISLAECLANGTRLQRVDLRKNGFQLAGLMALAAALKLSPTVTCLDLNCNLSDEHSEDHVRLKREISDLCEAHRAAIEAEAAKKAAPCGECVSRKTSLTCPIPTNENTVPVIRTEGAETITEEDEEQNTKRKFRSPLPSPSPSPSPSPLPSPVPSPSSRFKVTRVEGDSPLPSPRSRFTVTPVKDPDAGFTNGPVSSGGVDMTNNADCANLVRSSPSKIIVGFDVVDQPIST